MPQSAARLIVNYWAEDAERGGKVPTHFASLKEPIACDYLVIGGGFSGLSSALELKRRDPSKKVVLIEAERVGFGASGRNAGMVVPLPAGMWFFPGSVAEGEAEWGLADLMRRFHSVGTALSPLDGGARPCTFYSCAPGPLTAQGLFWLHAQLQRHGQKSELISAQELDRRTGEKARLSIAYPAYSVHPARLAFSLREELLSLGVEVYEQSRVSKVDLGGPDVTALTEAGGECRAKKAVFAYGAWSPGMFETKGKLFETFMYATEPLPKEVIARLGGDDPLVNNLYKDFSYRRVLGDRLLMGGLDDAVPEPSPKGEVPDNIQPRLERLKAKCIPWMKDVRVEAVWGGPIHAYGDLLPSFRHLSGDPRVTVIDGMAGAGVIWALLAGQLISGLVDPALDTPQDRRLRAAVEATRFPYLGFLSVGVRLVARMLLGRPAAR
jgi:glycine/D-amino acid oxidase-like deaminating enzyme